MIAVPSLATLSDHPMNATLRGALAALLAVLSPLASAAPGDVDATFNPNANGAVFSTAVQPDGKIVIGGDFTIVGGVARNRIARLNADGTLAPAFNPNANGRVSSAAVQADGKIVIGGQFTTVGGVTRRRIARLNADGTLDPAFNPNANSEVFSTAVQADGRILIWGAFSTVGGQARAHITRLNADGTLDPTFNANTTSHVYSATVQTDGRIVIGGLFGNVNDVSRAYIARLNADGTLDAAFNPNVGVSLSNEVYSTAVQADGKIVIGGEFTIVGGVTRNNFARLNADGTLDAAFNPNANGIVWSTTVQADGKILIGGLFTTVGGVTRNRIARLNADGTLDPAFNPNAGGDVYSTAVQANGKIVIGTNTSIVGGVTRNGIARLENDPATQTLTVLSANRIQWLRGGASPEIGQVTFELSTDGGANWSPLGSGTRIAGGWERTGLSLPSSGFIRARGRTVSGIYGGSFGIVEVQVPYPTTPPTVSTGSPTDVTPSTATLSGTVNPGSLATSAYFEYGLTAAYGNTTAVQDVGSGSSVVAVSEAISGLQVVSTYHFRMVGTNAGGTAFGADQTFTTGGRPPLAVTNGASSVTASGAMLNATVTPRDTATSVVFEWGATTSYGNTTSVQNLVPSTTAQAVGAALSGLSPLTLIHYRVVATNADGSAIGADATFTTLPLAPEVSGLVAANVTNTGATLQVQVNPNKAATTGYFQYGTTTGYGSQTAVLDAGSGSVAGTVSVLLTGLSTSNTYHYRFVAVNAGGTTVSGDATFFTVNAGNFAPAVATGSASMIGTDTATLNGAVNPNGGATTTYFEYGTTTGYGTRAPVPDLDIGGGTSALGLSELVAGLLPNTLYHFRIVATNSQGTTPGSDSIFTTKPLPPVATTSAATGVGFASAMLTGTVNANGAATSGYFEWGTTTSYGNQTPGQNLGNGSSAGAVSAAIGGLAANATYHYRLVATNPGGTSLGDDVAFTTTSPPPAVTTTAPVNVTTSGATLRGTVNPNGAATNAYFEWSTAQDFSGATTTATQSVGSGNADAPITQAITGLTPATQYFYRIVATNLSGTNRGLPASFTAVPLPAGVTTGNATSITSTSATLSGTVDTKGVSGTAIFEYGETTAYDQSVSVQGAITGAGPQTVSVAISGLSSAKTYHFRLVANTDGGRSEGSDATFTTTDSAAPVAVPDTIFHTGQVVFEPLLNDADADDGDVAGLAIAPPLDVAGLRGTTTISDDGKRITYTVDSPDAVAAFRYRARDAHGTVSNPGIVTLVHYRPYAGHYQPAQAGLVPQSIPVGSRRAVAIAIGLDEAGKFKTGSSFYVFKDGSGLGGQKLEGSFGTYGRAKADFTNPDGALTRLDLALSGNPADRRITGSISITDADGTFTAALDLPVAGQAPRATSGKSVAFIDPPNAAAASAARSRSLVAIPGDGFLTMTVGKDRRRGARFVGRLPDAQPFSAGDRNPDGATYRLATSRLYQRAGKSHGTLAGSVDAVEAGGVPLGLVAELDWDKAPDPDSTYYRDGIAASLIIDGIPYPKPARNELIPIGLSPGLLNATLRLSDGNLTDGALPDVRDVLLSIFPTRAVIAGYVPGTTGSEIDLTQMKLTLVPKSGLFSGRFIHPATQKPVKFQGAFKPAFGDVPGEGRGSFAGQTESGSVRITVNDSN